jgi:hypothetical protein
MHYQASGSSNLGQFPGYSVDAMIAAWKEAADIVHSLYHDCVKIYSLSFQPLALPYVREVIKYVTTKYSKAELAFQFNSLQEGTSRSYIEPQLALHRQGYWNGAEKVQPDHNVGFKDFPELDYIVNYPGDEKYL